MTEGSFECLDVTFIYIAKVIKKVIFTVQSGAVRNYVRLIPALLSETVGQELM